MSNEKAALLSQEASQPSHRIVALLAQIDLESENFKLRIADLLAQVETLRTAAKNKDAGNDLMSQLREANQNLVIATLGAQDMQEQAETVNRQQEEFLSMLAHELRNPLAPIAMAAELLGRVTSAHPQLPRLHIIIDRQVKHMTRLVNDLVDAARVNSGKITLQKHRVLFADIIESAVETSQPFIDKRHQHLAIDLPAGPVVIDGDLIRLSQVFSNLLINAAKFTPEHEHINIAAYKSANAVTVSVKDNGMGIDADTLPLIFDLFRQGFRTLDRAQGGLGIGLSLVRTIVEMHGGTVDARSAGVGLGSEFIVVLPIAAESRLLDNSIASDTAGPHVSCRILLIEDNVDANETLNDLLTQHGHVVASVFDGTSGLVMARENNYDVIVCDIGLPGMDGYEVVKQLRRDASKPVPCIIGLTGYSQPQYRARAKDEGFDHYLVKPVATDMLIALIASSVAS